MNFKAVTGPRRPDEPEFISRTFTSHQEADRYIINWAAEQAVISKGFRVKKGSLDKEKVTKRAIGRNLYCHRSRKSTVHSLEPDIHDCPWKINLRLHTVGAVKRWHCTSRILHHTHELLDEKQLKESFPADEVIEEPVHASNTSTGPAIGFYESFFPDQTVNHYDSIFGDLSPFQSFSTLPYIPEFISEPIPDVLPFADFIPSAPVEHNSYKRQKK